ncbi:hypothetical protein BDK89_0145 [Ilumatobacter fluminis]|uniref:tRNA-guanine family transglycosylase n=1 Tax=Ilumatobacter fluminis TaxID=467091 RepID=A0A4R7HUQ6_9ACTN|nr:tRNA-guanine transglycosylase DpdA [Ilumatobacter fluminis]TDT14590.1 hypothetical protein BDK89_0145 [Ilumatobacter fluminis]
MRFFFPDSQDQVDPMFDFVTEEHPVHRIRQRDDRYAHEVLQHRPFDGLLISKSIVDGHGARTSARYTAGARNRLYRERARRFFRLDEVHRDVLIMGDCGAFTYFNEEEPPYSVAEVLDFYEYCGLDWGVAPDHIVFGFVRDGDPIPDEMISEWERRLDITLNNARLFLDEVSRRNCDIVPIGVAHGWSADSYAQSVSDLQDLGYVKIAMGGMVPLRSNDIVSSLEASSGVRKPETELHLLGITRVDEMRRFAQHGVTSFDSTSPFRQAFKDDTDNYYTLDSTYVAIKVPQVDGNASLKRQIKAGKVDQRAAILAERSCLEGLRAYDAGELPVEQALQRVLDYEDLVGVKKTREAEYLRTLSARPWKDCGCGICEEAGIEVIMFRGSERNKRRGFHNLAVFRDRISRNGFHSLQTTGEHT